MQRPHTTGGWLLRGKAAALGALAALALLVGCDAQRIEELEEGLATEQDVRARFADPFAASPQPQP